MISIFSFYKYTNINSSVETVKACFSYDNNVFIKSRSVRGRHCCKDRKTAITIVVAKFLQSHDCNYTNIEGM